MSDEASEPEAFVPQRLGRQLPKVYIAGADFMGDVSMFAVAEDGEVLAEHVCSSREFGRWDLHDRPGRHATYAVKFGGHGDGIFYQLVEVRTWSDVPADVRERNRLYTGLVDTSNAVEATMDIDTSASEEGKGAYLRRLVSEGQTLADVWRELNRPEIVVLCGSTRFRDRFDLVTFDLTMAGAIVLAPGVWVRSSPAFSDLPEDQQVAGKVALDELHKRKIDLADRVFIVNVGGYIGDSTRSEIEYAELLGKPIEYLEPAHVV